MVRTCDPNDTGDLQLYAASPDGINWTKPNLSLRSYYGSTASSTQLERPCWTATRSIAITGLATRCMDLH